MFLIAFFLFSVPLFRSAPHRAEELFALVPLVVPLNARLTVEFDLTFIACEAPERLLLHTTLGTVDILIASTFLTALGERVLGADTPRHSVLDPWVLLSFEDEEDLLDFFVVLVLLAAPPDKIQNVGCAVLCVGFL